MDGPGAYVPDRTEGIVRSEDLPTAEIKHRSRLYKKQLCPQCGHACYRDKEFTRTLHDLGDLGANRPIELRVRYSQHYCSWCNKYFNADLTDLADLGSHYTRRVVHLAVRLAVEDGLPYRPASWHLWRDRRSGLSALRPPLSCGNGPGEAGPTPPAGTAPSHAGQHARELVHPQPRKGPDLSR